MSCSKEVVIIGINHNDPFGPEKVTAILHQLKQQQFIPDAICVEWKEDLSQAVISQRTEFAKQVHVAFPQLSSEDVKKIERALAFEADVHIDIFPNTKTVWLDNDRDIHCTDDCVVNFHKYRLNTYRQYADNNASVDIYQITHAIMAAASANSECTLRDTAFYEMYRRECSDSNAVICIVGASHGNVSVVGTFAQRIQQDGNNVTFFDTTII